MPARSKEIRNQRHRIETEDHPGLGLKRKYHHLLSQCSLTANRLGDSKDFILALSLRSKFSQFARAPLVD